MEHSGFVGYASKQAHNMVRALVLAPGDLRERLKDAYSEFIPLAAEQWLNQVPLDLRNQIKAIKFGYDQLTANRLGDSEARELADQIVALDSDATRLFWSWPTAV